MGVKTIPKQYEYICDGCGYSHLQKDGSSGQYSIGCPPKWGKFTLQMNADFEEESFMILCPYCYEDAVDTIKTFKKRRATK